MVSSWILNAISKEIVSAFVFSTTSQELWLDLEEHFGESNSPLIYISYKDRSLQLIKVILLYRNTTQN